MTSIPGSFQTIAEVGIALAGFSGLFVALRRKEGPLSELQKFRLRLLFSLTFGAVFLSFLPELLLAFAVPDSRIWFDACATLFLYSLTLMLWWMIRSRQHWAVSPEIFNKRAFALMTIGHLVVIVLQAVVVFGVIPERAMGIFMLGLVWYLLHGAQQFFRMLFVLPRESIERN